MRLLDLAPAEVALLTAYQGGFDAGIARAAGIAAKFAADADSATAAAIERLTSGTETM